MKYRALLKKSLRLIKTSSGIVKSGDQIFLDYKKIGHITSIIEDTGLAMIKIEDAKYSKKNDSILSTSTGKIRIIS